jgi:hypothetical protein
MRSTRFEAHFGQAGAGLVLDDTISSKRWEHLRQSYS